MPNPVIPTQLSEKWALIQDISTGYRTERGVNLILKLLDILIEETRVENDTIPKEQLEYNQGKIAACRALKENIEKGIPNLAQAGIGKPR